MDEIHLDGHAWQSADDFYSAYLTAMGAPAWHGRNMDALWDSLTGGNINERNPPIRIRITGLEEMSPEAKEMTNRFAELVREARADGYQIELEPSAA